MLKGISFLYRINFIRLTKNVMQRKHDTKTFDYRIVTIEE